MQQEIYKYIAETGTGIDVSENEGNYTNGQLLWHKLNDFVEGEITDKFPCMTGAKLVAANWKKIVIHVYYKSLSDKESRQYQIVVLPSLIDSFRLKIIGPNKNNNKAVIKECAVAWLNEMREVE